LQEVAAALGVKYDTLSKAARDGRLRETLKKKNESAEPSSSGLS